MNAPVRFVVDGQQFEYRLVQGNRLVGFRCEIRGDRRSYFLRRAWFHGVVMTDEIRVIATYRTFGTFVSDSLDETDMVVALLVAATPLFYQSLSFLGLTLWMSMPISFERPLN